MSDTAALTAPVTLAPTKTWIAKMIETGRTSVPELRRRLDSWTNALTGLNTGRDKTAYTLPGWGPKMSIDSLEALYHNDDIATRIVKALPDECFREEWKIVRGSDENYTGDAHAESALLEDDFKRLSVRARLKEAMIWGRLYGLGACMLGVDDGLPWDLPLDPSRIIAVNALTVLEKREMIPYAGYTDLDDPKFGEIALYTLQPVAVFMGSVYGTGPISPVLIHESRLIKFGGELTGRRQRIANQGTDYSILQKCFRALQLTNNNWQSASTLLADAGQGVFKIRGLIDMIAQQPDILQSRMAAVDLMRSSLRAVVLDAGDEKGGTPAEEFTRVATPFNGIPDMLRETWNRLACAAEMPSMLMIGSKHGGLNSDSEEEMDRWYNSIEAERNAKVLPAAEEVLRACATARGFASPEKWTIKFGPLNRASPAVLADIRLKNAQADEILTAKTGIYTAEEVALARDADPSRATTPIDIAARKAMLATSLAAEKAETEARIKTAKAPVVAPTKPTAKPAKKKP